MSLNISTGEDEYKINSKWESIRGKRRQQSMNAKRRNLNAQPEPNIYEKEIILSSPIIKNIKILLDKLNLIISMGWNNKNELPFDYIREFMSRPRVWAHILVDWDLYEIVRLPVYPEWSVTVRKIDC